MEKKIEIIGNASEGIKLAADIPNKIVYPPVDLDDVVRSNGIDIEIKRVAEYKYYPVKGSKYHK